MSTTNVLSVVLTKNLSVQIQLLASVIVELFPVVGLSLSVSSCVVFLYCYECCPQGPFVLFFRAF